MHGISSRPTEVDFIPAELPTACQRMSNNPPQIPRWCPACGVQLKSKWRTTNRRQYHIETHYRQHVQLASHNLKQNNPLLPQDVSLPNRLKDIADNMVNMQTEMQMQSANANLRRQRVYPRSYTPAYTPAYTPSWSCLYLHLHLHLHFIFVTAGRAIWETRWVILDRG
ncbi:hypothetical protein B0T14DRAFT_525546 [Immersiella caudata]|uniref:Uncharacterized protein n=1 Tax=Immersiella caudata TaxID=314043 RepID=A0AA40BXT7_9PEZI|nr:hypothetical protein B0T14DRAFT_525546 [Immersiella caudata]